MFPFGVVRMISPTAGESALWRERFSAIRPPHTSGAPDGARAGEYAPLLISLTKEREIVHRWCSCASPALQNGWGRDSAQARGAPLVHGPNERKIAQSRQLKQTTNTLYHVEMENAIRKASLGQLSGTTASRHLSRTALSK